MDFQATLCNTCVCGCLCFCVRVYIHTPATLPQAQIQKQIEGPLGNSESNLKCHLDPWAGPPLFNMTYNALLCFFLFSFLSFLFTQGLYKNSKKDYEDEPKCTLCVLNSSFKHKYIQRALDSCRFDISNLSLSQLQLFETRAGEQTGIITINISSAHTMCRAHGPHQFAGIIMSHPHITTSKGEAG